MPVALAGPRCAFAPLFFRPVGPPHLSPPLCQCLTLACLDLTMSLMAPRTILWNHSTSRTTSNTGTRLSSTLAGGDSC